MTSEIQREPRRITFLRAILQTDSTYNKSADYVSDTRDPDKVDLDKLPPETVAIQFYDRMYAETVIEDEIVPMQSGELNPSLIVWLPGELLNINQMADLYPQAATRIVPQMTHMNVSHVVYSKGRFKPFNPQTDIFWNEIYKGDYYARENIT